MKALHGAEHAVMPDRIEAGTYAIAAAIAGGEVELVGARRDTIAALLERLERTGAEVSDTPRGHGAARERRPADVGRSLHRALSRLSHRSAGPVHGADDGGERHLDHPRNDFREPLHACAGTWRGWARDIRVEGDIAIVRGVEKLKGAPVMATDLRASVSLVLAGLAAEGETIVNRVYHLDRGFDRLEEKLSGVGADIARMPE